jgi:hypothetical protein
MKKIRQTGHVTTTPPGVDQLVTKGNKEVAISSLSPIVTQSTFQLQQTTCYVS